MADWSIPTVTSDYDDFVSEVKDRDVDAATMAESPTTPPTGFVRYNRSLNKLQEWSGSAWVDFVLSIAGGGTGGATASAARTALGIGSMGTQNSNSVTITGGSITGITLDASVLNSGTVALARGGTGASLALGANGTVLGSNGSAVAFLAGTSIAALNASNLSTGTVPDARLSSNVVVLSGAQTISGNKTFSGTTTLGLTTLNSTVTLNANISSSGSVGVNTSGTFSVLHTSGNGGLSVASTIARITNAALSQYWGITSGTLSLGATTSGSATGGGVGVLSIEGFITVLINGSTKKIAYYGV